MPNIRQHIKLNIPLSNDGQTVFCCVTVGTGPLEAGSRREQRHADTDGAGDEEVGSHGPQAQTAAEGERQEETEGVAQKGQEAAGGAGEGDSR